MAQSLKGAQLKVAPGKETQEDILNALYSKFLLVQSGYTARNQDIVSRRAFFEGVHWAEDPDETEEHEFRLVINYCRRVVLDFAGMLSRAPTPRVPSPVNDKEGARRRELLLRLIWPDFLKAWRLAELNAAKCSYGVLEVLWDDNLEVETREVVPETQGPNGTEPSLTVKRYTKQPYIFRSIKPEEFFPVYRTFDKPDDFLYTFRFDPNRLITDLEDRYGVVLQGTDLDGGSAEPTADLIEYFDDGWYVLVAKTLVKDPMPEGRGIAARFRRATQPTYSPSLTLLTARQHKYYRPPFWVLRNIENTDANPTDGGSLSDIDDISTLNQHLNLMRSEQAEEIVINIHRPLTYASDDHQQDPETLSMTAGAVYPIGLEEKLEPVPTTPQPAFVQKHIDDIERTIRTLSFLGDAGFGDFGSGTSGVAARIALTPMQRILELKLPPRTDVLQSVCKYLLQQCEEKLGKDTKLEGWVETASKQFIETTIAAQDIDGKYFVFVDYGNLLPKDDQAHQQNEVYKYKSGTQSLWKTMDNLGEEDPDAEIARIEEESKNPYLDPQKYILVQQATATSAAPPTPAGGGGGAGAGAPSGLPTDLAGAGGGSTAPPTPSPASFPRAPNAGGYGAGPVTPFLPRETAGAGAMPLAPAGPGANPGGMG